MIRTKQLWMSLLVGGAVLVLASGAYGFSSGPPDGVAGNPPSANNCTICHVGFPVNSGDGALELVGVPTAPVVGVTYDLIVRLQDLGQARWGFELTVLDANDQPAGELIASDPVNTQLSETPGNPTYLKHTSLGTAPGSSGPQEWTFQWLATSSDPVVFYAAGNAANNDASQFGDYIYTIELASGGATPVESASWARVKALFRGAP